MKVYINTDYCGNEIIMAANTPEEAHELFAEVHDAEELCVYKEEWFEYPILEAKCDKPRLLRY